MLVSQSPPGAEPVEQAKRNKFAEFKAKVALMTGNKQAAPQNGEGRKRFRTWSPRKNAPLEVRSVAADARTKDRLCGTPSDLRRSPRAVRKADADKPGQPVDLSRSQPSITGKQAPNSGRSNPRRSPLPSRRNLALSDLACSSPSLRKLKPRNAQPSQPKNRERERALCLLYTSPSPRDQRGSRMPSSA